jgi:hypothetical protein
VEEFLPNASKHVVSDCHAASHIFVTQHPQSFPEIWWLRFLGLRRSHRDLGKRLACTETEKSDRDGPNGELANVRDFGVIFSALVRSGNPRNPYDDACDAWPGWAFDAFP